MRLAEMAAARHCGVSLQDVMDEFQVNHRTAQRMMRGLESIFPTVSHSTDDERRKRWKLFETKLLRMQGIRDNELTAMEMSIQRAQRDCAELDVNALITLRDRLLATMPSTSARRAETDAAAVLEAQGFACRPGPKAKVEPERLATIMHSIKAPFSLDVVYQGAKDAEPRTRRVEPYGVLLGVRHYLIARDTQNNDGYRRYRMDRILDLTITLQSFVRDPAFNLEQYAARSFGSFHNESEYGDVVWRFSGSVADVACDFVFHPTQKMTMLEDGSLIVEFTASGWQEMTWHLAKWGDHVEVIAPDGLKEMVSAFRRGDIHVLP